jgi:hypothetical protein
VLKDRHSLVLVSSRKAILYVIPSASSQDFNDCLEDIEKWKDDDVNLIQNNVIPIAWVILVRFAVIQNFGVHPVSEAYEEASDSIGDITSL